MVTLTSFITASQRGHCSEQVRIVRTRIRARIARFLLFLFFFRTRKVAPGLARSRRRIASLVKEAWRPRASAFGYKRKEGSQRSSACVCARLSTALYASPEKRVTRSAVEEETSKSEERASYEWTGREEKRTPRHAALSYPQRIATRYIHSAAGFQITSVRK